MKKQVELSITHNGKDVVTYPYTKKEHVQFENGMNIDEFVGQDIATPTITHDTTAIKVGVGDSDVSSSVVDSAVNMTIKGETYQNILPDPTLRNEMQGKSMQRLNEGYDNIEVVDGISKSAILKGNTLVNINSCYTDNDFIAFNNATIDSDGWITITANGNYLNAFPRMNNLIKPNTKYLAIIEVKENTLDGKFMPFTKWGEDTCFTTNFQDMNNSDSWVINAKAKGVFKSFLLTKDDYANANVLERSYVDVACTTGSITYRTMLIEYQQGMENWDIPFFRGMQSVKMPVLKTVGKNLFPPLTEYDSITQNVTGEEYELTERKIVWNSEKIYTPSIGYYFNLKPNTKYTFSCSKEGNPEVIIFDRHSMDWDANHSICAMSTIETTVGKRKVCNFTTRSDGKVCIRLSNNTGYTIGCWIEDCSLTEFDNNNTHVYEPYKTNILSTPEEMVLKGLGDVQDTLNVNTGEYVQRVKEVIYTGEEDGWSSSQMPETPNNISFYIPLDNHLDNTNNPTMRELVKDNLGFTNNCRSATVNEPSLDGKKGFSIHNNGNVYFTIPTSECANLDAWKSRLRTQPLVLQYPVKNPIIKTVDLSILDQNGDTQENLHSFANGHLQVSSEAENSLLPSVQYEIPTKNSYHMDLMKANATYTMKLASGNGSINKWDGEAIGFMLSRTFNSGTLPKDNLFYTTGWVNDLMILEGNLNAKTIPYFKGIKSAFENEDKIEVLSTGKNLCDSEPDVVGHYVRFNDGKYIAHSGFNISKPIPVVYGNCYRSNTNLNHAYYDENMSYIKTSKADSGSDGDFYTKPPKNAKYLRVSMPANQDPFVGIDNLSGEYKEPNISKIPLLSPLRSLPNGICDELNIDRLNHKAKLIQRVGHVILDGSVRMNVYPSQEKKDTLLIQTKFPMTEEGKSTSCISDTHPYSPYLWTSHITEGIQLGGGGDEYKHIDMRLSKTKVSSNDATRVESYLSKNPTTVLYELKTPIVTEIDLEGYPYAYKDGHIFLNSDIAPTTQITYSINQAQQIESANENLQRHEKEISHLQKLIAQYIQVEYESTLLSLKI